MKHPQTVHGLEAKSKEAPSSNWSRANFLSIQSCNRCDSVFPPLVSISAPVPSATVWSHVSLSYPLIGLTYGRDGWQPTNYINPAPTL